MQLVQTENSSDVLGGRGNGPNNHSGNIVFRRIVSVKREDYSKSSNKEKQEIIEEVNKYITTYGGRFLSEKDQNGWRHVLDLKDRKKKIAQALREKPRINNATGGDTLSTQQDSPTDNNMLREESKDQNIYVEPVNNPHLEKSISFNWETLKNGKEENLNDSIVDALMASQVSMNITPLSEKQSRYEGLENEENMSMSMDQNWEMKYDVQPAQSNSPNTKDENVEPWSTSLTPNQSLPPPNFFNEDRKTQYRSSFTLPQFLPPSYFSENQEAKYSGQDRFDQTAFWDEHYDDIDKTNEQILSSQTKHINSCNEAVVKKCKKQNCFNAPNSGQSDVSLNYNKLMGESIISLVSVRGSVRNPEYDDDDDESKDNVDGTMATNGIHVVTSDQSSYTSVRRHETDKTNPFDMSLASVVHPIDFNENQAATCCNKDHVIPRKSIITWKGLLSLSQRKLLSKEDKDGNDESDEIQTTHGHGMSTNDKVHEKGHQPLSLPVASNPPTENYTYAAHNDTNEMSFSTLFPIQRLKRVFQNEKNDYSASLNNSVSDFSFDDNLTDDESDDKPCESFCPDMREMMAKFKSMSSRDITSRIYKV